MQTSKPFDFSVFGVGTLDDDDRAKFWRESSPEERLLAVETLRQVLYDYDPVSDRIPRVLEVAELTGG